MKAKQIKEKPPIEISFTHEEAKILKGLVQNSSVPPEDESTDCSKFREDLFNLLKDYV